MKTKRITCRLDEPLYRFLDNFSRNNNMNISEIVRDVLVYFHLGCLTGDIQKTLPQLKKEFVSMDLKRYNSNRRNSLPKRNRSLSFRP